MEFYEKYIYYADMKIYKIKKNVYDKLAFYVFLSDLYGHIKLPGPYVMLDKVLLLVQHLLTGYTASEIEIYIPETSFYILYESLYIKSYEYLEKWIDNKLRFCFLLALLRLLFAKKFNPLLLNNVALFLDGLHNRIVYQDINLDKSVLYSWKQKKMD